MPIYESFLMELNEEAKATRKLLERVPEKSFDWKPHEKSFTLIRLASHVAELPGWISFILDSDELDFGKYNYIPPEIFKTSDLIKLHDECVAKAIKSLESANDEEFSKNWTMRNNEIVYFSRPKITVLRDFSYNHLYHHRGQLTVYLRLLDVPLPGVYGPTADEKIM
ncbi:MAG: DinB family protein [Ignavibacteria bacterium]|jgi:uncharacterized damage-inducible protein DinB